MQIGRYDYEELRAAAESGNKEDINRLGEWFDLYDNAFAQSRWNGEYYDADGINLYRLVAYDRKYELLVAVGYTASREEHDEYLEKAIADGYEG